MRTKLDIHVLVIYTKFGVLSHESLNFHWLKKKKKKSYSPWNPKMDAYMLTDDTNNRDNKLFTVP